MRVYGDGVERIDRFSQDLLAFVDERDWQQFHSPKNPATALTVEAAELLELFQWHTEAESRNLSPSTLEAASKELADVFIYTLRMSQVLGVDLIRAAEGRWQKTGSSTRSTSPEAIPRNTINSEPWQSALFLANAFLPPWLSSTAN